MRRTAAILFLSAIAGVTGVQAAVIDTLLRADTVVIVRQRVDKAVIPARTLEGEELRRLSVVSVADAIRYFSGVQVKDYGGIGGLKTVNIRSMGSQHVGVFYDGVQLGNAQNGTIDLGRFSMDNMEAIALYNGQKSDILQSAKDFASAGAVYMATRRPEFSNGKRDNLRLSFTTGSFGTVNPAVLWEHRTSGNLDAQFNVEHIYTTGRYKFSYKKLNGYDTTSVRQNGDVRALRVEGGLFGRLSKGDWRTKIYLYDSERGYPGASVREEPGKFRNEDRQWDRNFFVQSSLRQYFGRYNLMVNAKYAHDYLRYLSDPRRDVTTMYVDNRYRQQEAYLSAANEVALTEWWRVSFSADAQYNSLSADLAGFGRPSRLSLLSAGATAVEIDKVKLQASLLYTHVDDKPAAADRNEWTPTIAASWQVAKGLSLRAFYKSVFRMPTLNDLYYTVVGNKSLDPERAGQYDLGVLWSRNFEGVFKHIEMQVDGYFNRVDDKIIAMPTSNQFQWAMVNLGYVEIKGVDVSVQGDLSFGGLGLKTRIAYTCQRAQDLTDRADQWYGGMIPYVPRHSGSAIVGAMWRNWDVNYSFIYTGQRYSSRANIPENHIQPWYTHDMSLSRTMKKLRLTVELNNIFDQQYEVVECYPMPGTNIRVKITLSL